MTSVFHINFKLAVGTSVCRAVGAAQMGASALTVDDASLAERCMR